MQEPKKYNCSNATLYPDGSLWCDFKNPACPCAQHEFGKPEIFKIDFTEHRKAVANAQKKQMTVKQLSPEEAAKADKSAKTKNKKEIPTQQGRLF